MTLYKIMEDIESGKISTEEGYEQMTGEITNNIRTWFWTYRRRLEEIKDSPDLLATHRNAAEYMLDEWKKNLDTRYLEEVWEPDSEEIAESYYDWLDRQCEFDDYFEGDLLTEQPDIPDDDVDLPFY